MLLLSRPCCLWRTTTTSALFSAHSIVICSFSTNVYHTAVFRGCHSFSNIDVANIMLNHPEYYHYKPVFGMQNTSNESDEATSHPIKRVPVAAVSGKDSEAVHVVSICQWHISIYIFHVNKFGKHEYKY